MQVLTYNYIFSLNLWLLFCPEWLCFDWSMGCIPIVTINDVRIIFVLIFWLSLAFIIWKIIFMKNLFFFYHIRTRDSKLMNNNNTLLLFLIYLFTFQISFPICCNNNNKRLRINARKKEEDLKKILRTIKIFSSDINMKFGLKKCARDNIVRRKLKKKKHVEDSEEDFIN